MSKKHRRVKKQTATIQASLELALEQAIALAQPTIPNTPAPGAVSAEVTR